MEVSDSSLSDSSLQEERIEAIVRTFVRHWPSDQAIDIDGNLSELGLSSMDMVNLLIAVEAEFNVTVPGTNLSPEHFRSIRTIDRLVSQLLG
ncbi:MAG: phosphopantetheine-binding protein [Alphaproteobacteria bacterium]|nr:phosphopantetheine-binding protein [Alphaproteobacteria bacterium]